MYVLCITYRCLVVGGGVCEYNMYKNYCGYGGVFLRF